MAAISEAICVPLGTLKDGLQGGQNDSAAAAVAPTDTTVDPVKSGQIETVIAPHRAWEGRFSASCDQLHRNLRIPFGRPLIASILAHRGERRARRRSGRSPDEKALRGAIVEHPRAQPAPLRPALFRPLARRIHASFAVHHHDRQDVVRFIASRTVPLA